MFIFENRAASVRHSILCTASALVLGAIAAPGTALAQNSITTTQTNTSAPQDFTVPDGYVEAEVSATGADGGNAGASRPGGEGATATGVYNVSTGDEPACIMSALGTFYAPL